MSRLQEYYHSLKTIYMVAAIITGLICLAAGFIAGYIVCWRNPPKSLLQKAANKVS